MWSLRAGARAGIGRRVAHTITRVQLTCRILRRRVVAVLRDQFAIYWGEIVLKIGVLLFMFVKFAYCCSVVLVNTSTLFIR